MYLKQGQRLHNDKYQLLNVLGEGGFSLTYRGAWKTQVHGNLGKIPTFVPVCIKEYFFKDYCYRNTKTYFVETNSINGNEIFNKNKEKIIREARILAEINHPNVVNVLEVFKQNNTVYIVMEFISGHSLKSEVETKGIFPEDKLKKIIFKVGQALDYIHEKNILHLDIKPSNILMDQNNNPKLIDFGISKKYDLFNDQETSTALLAASRGYASVEQYDSEGIQVFSPRPDIYSLGATMYYLLTGQVPTESILRSTKGLQSPREINPEISENTEKVILKAMALSAAGRYESVIDMLVDLGFDPAKDKIVPSSENLPEHPEITTTVDDELYDFDAEDETLIQINGINSHMREKREQKYAWLLMSFPFLASAIMALILFGGLLKKNPYTLPVEVSQAINNNDIVSDNNPDADPDPMEIISQDTIKSDLLPTPVMIENQIIIPEETKENKFQKYFDEARTAYNNRNFSLARELFIQTESIAQTPEIERYKALIVEELEKEEIENRKNNFELFREFDNFAIGKKKSNDKYGAINGKAEEVIEFKYIHFERSGDNWLFQREGDYLYDKYGSLGELIASGVDG